MNIDTFMTFMTFMTRMNGQHPYNVLEKNSVSSLGAGLVYRTYLLGTLTGPLEIAPGPAWGVSGCHPGVPAFPEDPGTPVFLGRF